MYVYSSNGLRNSPIHLFFFVPLIPHPSHHTHGGLFKICHRVSKKDFLFKERAESRISYSTSFYPIFSNMKSLSNAVGFSRAADGGGGGGGPQLKKQKLSSLSSRLLPSPARLNTAHIKGRGRKRKGEEGRRRKKKNYYYGRSVLLRK